ncbi:SLED domain,Mbt repeat [Cinara cedri]|uniref:SLED domain,Mbt repeat n=1 Tax=Cinara cedri TaxID=506608 RepID=A0A5E4MBV1_9HEMI|nr:SLED domain,Mbt repeat [Cinara cedri]
MHEALSCYIGYQRNGQLLITYIEDRTHIMSSTSNFDESIVEPFNWNKYHTLRKLEEVPEDFFPHVCKSEQNGIELGSVVEVENEDKNGYWFASVCLSKGVSINLHYIGDKNNKHDFWLELKSSRIHPLNWGSKNYKKLVPPCPDRFLRKGVPIYNIFKPGMFVEVQDKEYPYGVWTSKILKNVGGRLFVKMLGVSSPEETPFWLFYSNERIFPLGWADQKGLPWRVMNVDVNIKNLKKGSSLLMNVLKPKFPEQHSYKVGDMLEAINPYSLMVFYVATVVKVYDNRYFKVEMDNDSNPEKRISFVATKENSYLFKAGWASKHKFLLKPPSDWDSSKQFSWLSYAVMKSANLAQVDNPLRKNMYNIHAGMTLEAVDPINPDHICVATIKGFADHWIFLSFDRTNWCQELLHVQSIYSDDIFPIGWCNKHKYSLSTPKLPFINCNNYENHYVSDIDTNFESHKEFLTKYPNYFKGEIPYHYSEMDNQTFEESLLNKLVGSDNLCSDSKTENNDVTEPIIEVKQTELVEEFYELNKFIGSVNLYSDSKTENNDVTELVEEFHDALFSKGEKEVVTKQKCQVQAKKKFNLKKQIKTLNTDNYKMCIYFNKNCYTKNCFLKKKLGKIPNFIGPGPVSTILHQAISIFVRLSYVPLTMLKKIKKNQSILFNGPGGINMVITALNKKSVTPSKFQEQFLLPESKKLAQIYTSNLCHLFGVCEYFMTTEKIVCPHCIVNENKIFKFETNAVQTETNVAQAKTKAVQTKINAAQTIVKPMKRNNEIGNSKSSKKHGNELLYEKITRVAAEELDWSNKHLIEKFKYYMGCIINFEDYVKRLSESLTQHELALLVEIEAKKVYLRDMDDDELYSNTKSDLDEDEEKLFPFVNDWKTSFENFYRQSPVYMNTTIDIGDFEHIKVTSNPKFWCPYDVQNYLSNDMNCTDISKKLKLGLVDGVAFMLLNEEQLVYRLKYSINLAIRVMCHVAHVKHIFLTKYN